MRLYEEGLWYYAVEYFDMFNELKRGGIMKKQCLDSVKIFLFYKTKLWRIKWKPKKTFDYWDMFIINSIYLVILDKFW